MSYYDCPICGKSIPVRSPKRQAYGLVRSNHLRSHGINSFGLTKEQKESKEFLINLYKMQQFLDSARHRNMTLIYTTPKLKGGEKK